MKKTLMTIAIMLGMGMATFAEHYDGGGLFQRGVVSEELFYGAGYPRDNTPLLPSGHNLNENQNADPTTPLGSGIAVLLGLGAAYAVAKKRRDE